ncbi:flavin-containing monooxygenase [Porticoccus sp.]|nr:MAG: NAD(P)/FAD-dependent oxidoreductase [Gammaproteobacteria bacterium]
MLDTAEDCKAAVDSKYTRLDALVIGAGIAGIYQLYQLRELDLDVMCVDSAPDVGGTWYWNRYPGARLDSDGPLYQYIFSEELYKDWSWSERFPGQEEIEKWTHYVVDKLDLRKDMQFKTTVERAFFDELTKRWIVVTTEGEIFDTLYLITCCGMLSAPMTDVFHGQETFKGNIFHTARWPQDGVELEGKRVGVIGIGATGIQVIQTIADKVEKLKVFVRTPQYILPMKNPKYDEEDVAAYKSRFDEIQKVIPHTFAGVDYDLPFRWHDCTPEQRAQLLEDIYQDGSLKMWLGSFAEMYFDKDVSEEVSEFIRGKMRERLKDPKLIEMLVPSDYGFGIRRVPLETNYLETYHRPNVEAVSVKDNPIVEVVPEGIKLADGTVHELDIIVMATGFDAGSGALTRMDIRGREGRSLTDDWSRDIRTTMGLMIHGYPNLFTTAVPLAPSAALCNMTTCLQQQTEWIADCIHYLEDNGLSYIEPDENTESAWVEHHDETANANLISKTESWYLGANVPGKPRRVLSYTGGVGTYRKKCSEVAEAGYPGFTKR